MKPLVRAATAASSGESGNELSGDFGVAVMLDAEHQLVEDQELPDPQDAEGSNGARRDARRLQQVRVEVRLTERAGEVGQPRREGEADEVERPERDGLLPQVALARLAPH